MILFSSPPGHLAMFGDILGCQNWCGGCHWHLIHRDQGQCQRSSNAWDISVNSAGPEKLLPASTRAILGSHSPHYSLLSCVVYFITCLAPVGK